MWLILSNAFSQSRKIKFGYIFYHIPYSSLFGLLLVKSIPVHLEKSVSWRSGSMSAKAGITVAGRAQVMKRGKRGFPASPKTPQGGLQIKHSRATNQTPWTCNWPGRVCTASHFWHIFFFEGRFWKLYRYKQSCRQLWNPPLKINLLAMIIQFATGINC